MSNQISNEWFFTQSPIKHPRLRLFCFPYAGGSASIFNNWYKNLPRDVELVAIQLPGRTTRLSTPPIDNLPELLKEILPAIKPLLNVPFAFFGHSNGAIICYELAKILPSDIVDNMQHIYISGKVSPEKITQKCKSISKLSNSELLKEVIEMGATPTEITSNPQIFELLLPMLRADFSIVDNYEPLNGKVLNIPATILYGDLDVVMSDIEGWNKHFTSDVRYKKFAGDHFFIDSQKEKLLEFLYKDIVSSLLEEHSH